jgi:hypothetical protein
MAPAPDVDVVEPGSTAKKIADVSEALAPSGSGITTPQGRLLKIKPRWFSDDPTVIFSDSLGESESKAKLKIPLPVVSQSQAPPHAPPLPFKFIGRYVEDGQTSFFLQSREQDIVVKVGDTVEQIYRVEAMTATALTFTFIPLSQKQTLDIGSTP